MGMRSESWKMSEIPLVIRDYIFGQRPMPSMIVNEIRFDKVWPRSRL
jgi:hypothetical protein